MAEGQALGPHAHDPARDDTRSRKSPWDTRLKVALGIAIAECLLVALEADFSRVTVIIIAIPIILFYLLAGRTLESRLARDAAWVLAVSQALAVIAAIIAIVLPTIAIVLAGVFGAIALYLLLRNRPEQQGRRAE